LDEVPTIEVISNSSVVKFVVCISTLSHDKELSTDR
jgi:hypothetical protein